MRAFASLLLLFLAQAAEAQPAVAATPIKWNGKAIFIGDTEGKLLAALGVPGQRVEVESPVDGSVSERWTFTDPTALSRPLIVKLRGGRVVEARVASPE